MTGIQGWIIIALLAEIVGLLTIIYFKLCEIYNSREKKERERN